MQHKSLEIICHLTGWTGFVLSALFFIGSSLKNGDLLSLVASILFLLACFAFIVPLIRELKDLQRKVNTR